MIPSLLELCDHARTSCRVNGLIPKEWRWGSDVAGLYASLVREAIINGSMDIEFGAIEMPKRFQGLPVLPMAARGVACIGKRPYVSLLEKNG